MIQHIKSFDQHIVREQNVLRPDKYSGLFKIFNSDTYESFALRGSGLSYAPLSLSKDHLTSPVINMEKFNRVLKFDVQKGLITCEPSITLIEILNIVTPKGWYIPILPGYPSITLAGCVAANIHGKSQYHSGNFGTIVKSIQLFHPDHGEMICSDTQNPEVFELSIGGLGLTGLMTAIEIQLKPLSFNAIQLQRINTSNVREAIRLLIEKADQYNNVYSWHDFTAKGKRFGRGIIFAETFQNIPDYKPPKSTGFVQSGRKNFPAKFIRYPIIKWINNYYLFRENTLRKSSSTNQLPSAFFPIWGQEIYFRLYGKKGFLEYQMIIKEADIEPILDAIQDYIHKNKQPVGLASLKLFKGKPTYLNFCDSGVCLTVDVPNTPESITFFKFLDSLCINSNSIVNIAKDSRLTAETVRQLFPGYTTFKTALHQYDPQRRFKSIISENLDL